MARFRVSARISSANLPALRAPLQHELGGNAEFLSEGDELVVRAVVEGSTARDLNRALLTALRRVEKRTRLRAEWTADGFTERFFDYVPKSRRPASE